MTRLTPGSVPAWTVRGIVGTMFPLLIVLTVVVTLGSGFVLEGLRETYLTNPVLLMMVPVMISTGGNLGAILSSRFSTRFHLGTLSFSPREEVIQTNVVAVLCLGSTIFVTLGFAAYAFGHVTRGDPIGLVPLLTISVVSGTLLTFVAVLVSLLVTYVSYRLGADPDDTTIPIVTNVCDVLGVIILTLVSIVVL